MTLILAELTMADVAFQSLVGIFVALAATYGKYYFDKKLQKTKAEADLGHADKDRTFTLRQEVYLASSESIEKKMRCLAYAGDVSKKTEEVMEVLNGTSVSDSKVHLIGSEDTVYALVEANQYFLNAIFELFRIRREIEEAQQQFDALSQTIGELYAQSMLAGLSGDPCIDSEAAPLKEKQRALKEVINSKIRTLLIEVQTRIEQYGSKLVEVNIKARQDLGLRFKVETIYRASMRDTLAKARRNAEAYLRDVGATL